MMVVLMIIKMYEYDERHRLVNSVTLNDCDGLNDDKMMVDE